MLSRTRLCGHLRGIEIASPRGMPLTRDNPEARAWLTSNDNCSALATNKFHRTARALAFLYELYEMGAKEVLIDDIQEEIRRGEGGRMRTV
jgi:hypothetical protein